MPTVLLHESHCQPGSTRLHSTKRASIREHLQSVNGTDLFACFRLARVFQVERIQFLALLS